MSSGGYPAMCHQSCASHACSTAAACQHAAVCYWSKVLEGACALLPTPSLSTHLREPAVVSTSALCSVTVRGSVQGPLQLRLPSFARRGGCQLLTLSAPATCALVQWYACNIAGKPALQSSSRHRQWVQVVIDIAIIALDEFTPAQRAWFAWGQLMMIADIVCCCAILFPIAWRIRHLREAAISDGKAVRYVLQQLFTASIRDSLTQQVLLP